MPLSELEAGGIGVLVAVGVDVGPDAKLVVVVENMDNGVGTTVWLTLGTGIEE